MVSHLEIGRWCAVPRFVMLYRRFAEWSLVASEHASALDEAPAGKTNHTCFFSTAVPYDLNFIVDDAEVKSTQSQSLRGSALYFPIHSHVPFRAAV